MHNIEHKVEGDNLVITINVGKKAIDGAPPSKTGKTRLVASTAGTVAVAAPGGAAVTFSMNVMTKS